MASGKIVSVNVFNGKSSKDGKPFRCYNGAATVTYGQNVDTVLFSCFGNTGVTPVVGQECELHDFRQDKDSQGCFVGYPKYRALYIKEKDGRYLKV